jgi:hypothetical protein
MQGTSLEEVFGSFNNSSGFPEDATIGSIYGLRRAPPISLRDLSGSTLHEIEQQRLLNSLTETLPILQPGSQLINETIEEYKSLRGNYNYLMNDITMFENNIQDLEGFEKKYLHALENYNNALLHTGVLSKEEYATLQEKCNELCDFQTICKTKCLSHYKEKVMAASATLSSVRVNLAAYKEFIKMGVKEMVGENVKVNSCSICLDKEISHCLVPCGHAFCEDCIKKAGAKTCMACRTNIQRSTKLFF